MLVKITDLYTVTHQILRSYGYTAEEAVTLGEVLMYAQLRGNSRGLNKLIDPAIKKPAGANAIAIQKQSKTTALLDAGSAHPMLAVSKAAALAIEKAKHHDIALIGVKSRDISSGALGYYVHTIASQGYVGIIFATTPPIMAPAGSYEPLLGANPQAIAIPTHDEPLVLDMDTAAIAGGGLRAVHAAGGQLPPGIAYDNTGILTRDPHKALEGAVLPFDKGYKGSHLGLMIQILAGPLLGLAVSDTYHRGHTVIALNPDALGGAEALKTYTGDLIRRIKASKKVPGVDAILLPGEREQQTRTAHLKRDVIDIDDNLYHTLLKIIA